MRSLSSSVYVTGSTAAVQTNAHLHTSTLAIAVSMRSIRLQMQARKGLLVQVHLNRDIDLSSQDALSSTPEACPRQQRPSAPTSVLPLKRNHAKFISAVSIAVDLRHDTGIRALH